MFALVVVGRHERVLGAGSVSWRFEYWMMVAELVPVELAVVWKWIAAVERVSVVEAHEFEFVLSFKPV